MRKLWEDRSIEIASLFNPAFCGIVLFKFIKGYEEYFRQGPEYSIIYLVLPLVLQEEIRTKMNGTNATTRLQRWIVQNPEVKIDFNLLVKSAIDITKEAIIFGANREIFEISHEGRFHSKKRRLSSQKWDSMDEREDIIKKASLIGKWFGQLNDAEIIFQLLGVRP